MAWRAVRNTVIFLFMIMLVICVSPALVRAQDGSGGGADAAPAVSGSENVDSILSKATAENGVSLQVALQSAMDTNPTFLSRKHAYSSSHEAYLKSFGALLPQVNAIASGGFQVIQNDTTSALFDDKRGEGWTNDMRVVMSQLLSTEA